MYFHAMIRNTYSYCCTAAAAAVIINNNEEQTSEGSDDVSPYLMVSCAQVHVRKFQERFAHSVGLFNLIVLSSLVY